AKLALDRGISGALEWPSAYFMKSPPIQHTDDEAHDRVECFIRGGDKVAENGLPASHRDGEGPLPAAGPAGWYTGPTWSAAAQPPCSRSPSATGSPPSAGRWSTGCGRRKDGTRSRTWPASSGPGAPHARLDVSRGGRSAITASTSWT